jgi:hypothetical protein
MQRILKRRRKVPRVLVNIGGDLSVRIYFELTSNKPSVSLAVTGAVLVAYACEPAVFPEVQNIQIDQARLRAILSLSGHHPEVRVHNGTGWDKVPLAFALRLVLRTACEWEGTARRVRKIRVMDRRKPLPFQYCHRTTTAATLQPSIEWMRDLYGSCCDSE